MAYPYLNELSTSRAMLQEFKGYNHNLSLSDNQFYDMKNLTSTHYPILSPRSKRGIITLFSKPNGLLGKNRLCWVDGTDFYYDGVVKGTVTDTEKQLVSMGAYILIWPDKKYFNTETDEYGNLGESFTTTGTVTISLTDKEGTSYTNYVKQNTSPKDPDDGELWLDISETPHVLKQYSEYSSSWVSITTTYVKIEAIGIGENFNANDGVSISGCTDTMFNTDSIIQAIATDYIVIIGILDEMFTQTDPITIERKIPDMDFIAEMDNRIWGCSSENHEIYACKLGDPKNWYCYAGISTDSYAVTVGSDGDFTGAISHLGYMLFFKEDCIHKIMGSKPANFQISTNYVRGVEKGSERSLIIVNETLYYKSRNGICAYEGSLPASLSEVLGKDTYKYGVAGSVGNKYYISMKDTDGIYHLFVYDEYTGLWHKEDNMHVLYFARVGGELYFIDADTKVLYSVNGSLSIYPEGDTYSDESTTENEIEWYAITGNWGNETPDSKYISKLQIRGSVEKGASFKIAIQYDESNVWEDKYVMTPTKNKAFTIPIIPKRCDHLKIKLYGKGNCKIFSIAKTLENGSEV